MNKRTKNITVTITGPMASGKTVLAEAVGELLGAYGVQCLVDGDDRERRWRGYNPDLGAIAPKMRVELITTNAPAKRRKP